MLLNNNYIMGIPTEKKFLGINANFIVTYHLFVLCEIKFKSNS